jgi:hypothetical protein
MYPCSPLVLWTHFGDLLLIPPGIFIHGMPMPPGIIIPGYILRSRSSIDTSVRLTVDCFLSQNAELLDSEIRYDRDLDYDYFGFKVGLSPHVFPVLLILLFGAQSTPIVTSFIVAWCHQ